MTDQPTICQACGAEHPSGVGYTRVGGRWLCGICATRELDRRAGASAIVMGVVIGSTALMWLFDAPYRPKMLLTAIVTTWAVLAMLTLVHESGHALVALLVGAKIRGIDLGAHGPTLLSLRRGQFAIRLRVMPIGGRTFFTPANRQLRWRYLLILVAGPAAAAALIVAVLAWQPASPLGHLVRWNTLILGVWATVLDVVIPRRTPENDARQFWRFLTMTDEEICVLSEVVVGDHLTQRLNDHVSGNPLSRDELREIRTSYLERMSKPGLLPEHRAVLANNLAVTITLLAEPELLPEADDLSAFAYEQLPRAEIIATRGAVLVGLGRYPEAIAMLNQALIGLTGHNVDAAHADAALAYIRQRDLYSARLHLSAIRSAPNVPAYAMAQDLIGFAELDNLLRGYGHDDPSPDGMVARLSNDAGELAPIIGDNISRYLEKVSDRDLERLSEASGAEVSREWLDELGAALATTLNRRRDVH